MTEIRDHRLDAVERDVSEIKQAIQSIAGSLQTLARLEERHQETREALNRSFAQLDDHEKRLRVMEHETPINKLVRNWVLAGVTAMAAFVLAMFAGRG
jgi:septal ring factor EnvC (AmiA/AmiB activator)